MAITVNIENTSGSDEVPDPSRMRRWISAALKPHKKDAQLSVQIISDEEMIHFNSQYRGKPYATNVLSFPADIPDFIDLPLLGDILVCATVVSREAREQRKTPDAHWAHMLVHGCLHLLGFDHEDDEDAQEMEALETTIITGLGFPPPYDAVNQAAIATREEIQ